MKFKPLLAASLDGVDLETLQFPLMVSPKLDGIRVVVHPTLGAVTRSLKPIPNEKVFSLLSDPLLHGFDGELVYGNATDKDAFNKTQSAVMTIAGPGMYETQTAFMVFDDFTYPDDSFSNRFDGLKLRVKRLPEHLAAIVTVVSHTKVYSASSLSHHENLFVEQGYEGVMLRKSTCGYKYGRSTLKEMTLAKLKRFTDTDGIVIGFEEMLHNDNEKTLDSMGNSKRASLQENKRPAGTLGALIVRLPEFDDATVKVGSGYTAELKQSIWDNQPDWLGAGVVVKYQQCGMKDLPRFPVFKGRRKD